MSQATPPNAEACPECGADRPAADASGDDLTPTHCEWCGAEYPVPDPRPDPAQG